MNIEFNQSANVIVLQSSDEAWVLGRLAMLKADIKPFERSYATYYKLYGFNFTQLLLLLSILYAPSLDNFVERFILVFGVLGIIALINSLHKKYIPHSLIYLKDKETSGFDKAWPSLLSLLIAVLGGAAATILATYLQPLLLVLTASQH